MPRRRWHRRTSSGTDGASTRGTAARLTSGSSRSRWELPTGGPFPDLATFYRGRQGALALWNALKTGPWDPDGGLPIERIEDRGETLLALLTMRARGAHSGTDLALKWAPMITRPGGEPAHPQLLTWREGLRAMGLPV
jgi:hypothetical protein